MTCVTSSAPFCRSTATTSSALKSERTPSSKYVCAARTEQPVTAKVARSFYSLLSLQRKGKKQQQPGSAQLAQTRTSSCESEIENSPPPTCEPRRRTPEERGFLQRLVLSLLATRSNKDRALHSYVHCAATTRPPEEAPR